MSGSKLYKELAMRPKGSTICSDSYQSDEYYEKLRIDQIFQKLCQTTTLCVDMCKIVSQYCQGSIPYYLLRAQDKKGCSIHRHKEMDNVYLPYQSALVRAETFANNDEYKKYIIWRRYLCTRQFFLPKTVKQASKIAACNRWVMFDGETSGDFHWVFGPGRQYAKIYTTGTPIRIEFYQHGGNFVRTTTCRYLSLLLSKFQPDLVKVTECNKNNGSNNLLKQQIQLFYDTNMFEQTTFDYLDSCLNADEPQRVDIFINYFNYLDQLDEKIWKPILEKEAKKKCIECQFSVACLTMENRLFFQHFYQKHFPSFDYQQDIRDNLVMIQSLWQERKNAKTYEESKTQCLSFLDDQTKQLFLLSLDEPKNNPLFL